MASVVQAADSGVWQEAAAEDEAAVAALYQQFVPQLTSYARRRGAEDPEDLANLAFFRAIKALPNLRNQNAPVFRAYLYRTVRNQIAGEYRQSALGVIPATTGFDLDHLVESDPTPEERVAAESGFESMLESLTPEQREVFQHRFRAGRTVAETARILDRTPAAIHGLQERGLRRLRFLAAMMAVAVAVGVVVLLELRTTSVINEPADQGPSISAPADDVSDGDLLDNDLLDNDVLEREGSSLEVVDGEDVEMRIDLETDTAVPGPAEGDAEQPSPPTSAVEATTTTTQSVSARPGSIMRPASANHMCLGYNQELSLMELQDCRDTLDQRWELRPSGIDGYYQLAVLSTGQCMYVSGFSSDEGAQIVGSRCGSEVDHGLWEFSGGPTAGYDGAPLIARHSGKCITVEGNSRHEGAVISQRGCGLAMYQVFSYET